MQYVYLHWGVSAWACYALVGVALGYFQLKKTPSSLSSVFYPLIGIGSTALSEMDQYIGDIRHWYRHIIGTTS